MRHYQVLTEYDPKRGVSVSTLAFEYRNAFHIPEHAHGADQLIYATGGIMEVSSGQSVWLIPPHFALWIPARTYHQIHMSGSVSMRTLYLRKGLAQLQSHCTVLHVNPLLRELIFEVVRLVQLRTNHPYECALREVLISQLTRASSVPTFITMPREDRALAVARAILRNPAESKPLAVVCSDLGVNIRTMERAFRKDVGSSLESWRRQVRLTKAVELLIAGRSIKQVAAGIGYRQSSAFVQMFRQTFGTTPKAWISALEESANDHSNCKQASV